jgi:phosphatidylserine/phosphatidylglycerophosphate/cardiolipin synthase-like enzyme
VYIARHWAGTQVVPLDALKAELRQIVLETLASTGTVIAGVAQPDAGGNTAGELSTTVADGSHRDPTEGKSPPPWLKVGARRVIDLYLEQLARSRSWKQLYVVSPWISEWTTGGSISFERLLERVRDDGATMYVVTRPPQADWHARAISKMAATSRANIAFVPELHAKLFTATTSESAFALVGSANLTDHSLRNREVGLLVNSYQDGARIVASLIREANHIYRTTSRTLAHKADFRTTARR